jgi:sulfatase maturation enzyme AslB (radical SAM superfamily)
MTRDNLRIRGLSLMTSLGCNLNCEYCHIAKSRNAHSPSI